MGHSNLPLAEGTLSVEVSPQKLAAGTPRTSPQSAGQWVRHAILCGGNLLGSVIAVRL